MVYLVIYKRKNFHTNLTKLELSKPYLSPESIDGIIESNAGKYSAIIFNKWARPFNKEEIGTYENQNEAEENLFSSLKEEAKILISKEGYKGLIDWRDKSKPRMIYQN